MTEPVVFVNVIEVDADHVDEVLGLLRDGLERVMSTRPGFEAAELLVDEVGGRIVNIARWRDAADIVATQQDPKAAELAARVAAKARSVRPAVFHAVHVHG